jgi:hypothetical protein
MSIAEGMVVTGSRRVKAGRSGSKIKLSYSII